MSCNSATLSGLAKDCTPVQGGIVEVYIANASDVSSVTASDGKISAISMVSSAKFKAYKFNRNTGSMTSTYTFDKANGVQFVSTDLVLVFNRMETTKRVEISALAVNDLAVIVKTSAGNFFYLGKDEPVNASAGDGQTGTARADANRYSITLQDNSMEMPFEVEASAVEAVI